MEREINIRIQVPFWMSRHRVGVGLALGALVLGGAAWAGGLQEYTEFKDKDVLTAQSLHDRFAPLYSAVKELQATVGTQAGTISKQATTIDALQKQVTALTTCPSDMVPVGDGCVDRYEASVWDFKEGAYPGCKAIQDAVDEAKAKGWTKGDILAGYNAKFCPGAFAMCNFKQYGSASDDYPAWFPDSGQPQSGGKLYGCAIKGISPSRFLTWFQAQQACVASGKHLITNGEWQAAVAGTPDPGGVSTVATENCVTNLGGPEATGEQSLCVSAAGVHDMIGNLWEWVDMWGQAGPVGVGFGQNQTAAWPAGYGGDKSWNVNGTAHDGSAFTLGIPAAAVRGGGWASGTDAGAFALYLNNGPSSWDVYFGFRCAAHLPAPLAP